MCSTSQYLLHLFAKIFYYMLLLLKTLLITFILLSYDTSVFFFHLCYILYLCYFFTQTAKRITKIMHKILTSKYIQ